MNFIQKIRFQGGGFSLAQWSLVKVCGEDQESFLQGQVTSNVSELKSNQLQLSARVNRSGQLVAFFFVGKEEKSFFILVPQDRKDSLLDSLNEFLVMEDVSFEDDPRKYYGILGPQAFLSDSGIHGLYGDEAFSLHFGEEKKSFSETEIRNFEIMMGFPQWNVEVDGKTLINNSRLENWAVDYNKGCFLGQETVAKIATRRGAAKFPALVEKEKAFSQVSLSREDRIEGKEIDGGRVRLFPFLKPFDPKVRAQEIYQHATKIFSESEEVEQTIELLKVTLLLDPQLADAYEVLGVLYGRLEDYQNGINFMDQLQAINPQSVMAHTNKSLFYMKLGKIEEAEKEKAEATVKSMKQFGAEAKTKKEALERQKQEKAEQERREGMFRQVLELDPNDELANFGLGELSLERKEYELAVKHFETVIASSPKYSVAYLGLGKSFEGQKKLKEARDIYEQGIPIAAKNGDLMPANEMQSRLNNFPKGT